MIDLVQLRKTPRDVMDLILRKDPLFDIQKLYDLDTAVRQLKQDVESMRSLKNDLASQAKSGITQELREKSIALGKDLKAKEAELELLEAEFKVLYLSCPNVPYEDVPVGNKQENVI